MLVFSNRELIYNPIEAIEDYAFEGLVKLRNL